MTACHDTNSVHNRLTFVFTPLGQAIDEREETRMNWDVIAGDWKQLKGKLKQRWGKLTDDNLNVIDGKRDELVGKTQEAHGAAKEAVEKQVKIFTPTNNDYRMKTTIV